MVICNCDLVTCCWDANDFWVGLTYEDTNMDIEKVLLDLLTRLDAKVDDIQERLVRVEERTSRKASLYGLLGGLLPAICVLIYMFWSK